MNPDRVVTPIFVIVFDDTSLGIKAGPHDQQSGGARLDVQHVGDGRRERTWTHIDAVAHHFQRIFRAENASERAAEIMLLQSRGKRRIDDDSFDQDSSTVDRASA
ncbi:hypothetical protein LTR94_028314, partial [Friedmanniomyces endolithicus]